MSSKKVSSDDWPVGAENYEIVGLIGKGNFGKVFLAKCVARNNEKVAVKIIDLEPNDTTDDDTKEDSLTQFQVSYLLKEASIMRRFRHVNILSFYSSFAFKRELWLVSSLACGSWVDIMKNVEKFENGFKDETILSTILNDVLHGIEYCHKDGRIHRDIKARNILISSEGISMLADFGVSGALLENGLKRQHRNTVTGTPSYIAPEVLKQQQYNHKADIWSVGITALELAFGVPPYHTLKPMKVMIEIMEKEPPTVDDMGTNNFSKHFKSFVEQCLTRDVSKRPTATDLIKHSFIKNFNNTHQYIIDNVLKMNSNSVTNNPIHEFPNSLLSSDTKSTSTTHDGIDNKKTKNENKNTIIENNDVLAVEFTYSLSIHGEEDIIKEQETEKKGRFTVAVTKDNNEEFD